MLLNFMLFALRKCSHKKYSIHILLNLISSILISYEIHLTENRLVEMSPLHYLFFVILIYDISLRTNDARTARVLLNKQNS